MFGAAMTVNVTWEDVAIRLASALLAGGLIGLNRSQRGRIAGLRTTILMCLAATAAMLEANLMLSVSGKTPGSFVVMDALRFPLGILSGIGFIGAGAIVRRGNLVTGVTTAATLWLITVIGLLLGAGYLIEGAAVTALAFLVLSTLKNVEPRLKREHRGHLLVRIKGKEPSNAALRQHILDANYTIGSFAVRYDGIRHVEAHLEWYSRDPQDCVPALVETLANTSGIEGVEWSPVSAGHLFE
jgi:putative Mg2+ transporter-C (MgtC) family protein